MKVPTWAQVARFVVYALVGVVVAVSLSALVIAATTSSEIRAQQKAREGQVESNDRTLAIIRSCTTPGRRCYERSRRQSARAVANINEVVVLAASCASGPVPVSVEDIQSCVIERLATKPGR